MATATLNKAQRTMALRNIKRELKAAGLRGAVTYEVSPTVLVDMWLHFTDYGCGDIRWEGMVEWVIIPAMCPEEPTRCYFSNHVRHDTYEK